MTVGLSSEGCVIWVCKLLIHNNIEIEEGLERNMMCAVSKYETMGTRECQRK